MGKLSHFTVLMLVIPLFVRSAAAGEGEDKAAALLYEAGLEKMETRDFARAADLFAKARANAPSDLRYLLQLSVAELRSNRPLDALAHLREYQADPRAAVADREKAKAYIEEAYARTGHLKVEGPPGAEVLVDSKPKGACPITAEIDVEADQPLDVQIKVENKSRHASVKCPAGQVVTVRVEGEGNATVRIGKHTTNGPPKDEPTERSTAGYVVPGAIVGLGVVGFVGAGIFTAMSGSAKSDAEAIAAASPGLCNDKASAACAPLKDKQDKQNTLATLSYVSLGIGAVATVVGVMTFVIWPKSKKSEVSVSPTAGGLLVSGKF